MTKQAVSKRDRFPRAAGIMVAVVLGLIVLTFGLEFQEVLSRMSEMPESPLETQVWIPTQKGAPAEIERFDPELEVEIPLEVFRKITKGEDVVVLYPLLMSPIPPPAMVYLWRPNSGEGNPILYAVNMMMPDGWELEDYQDFEWNVSLDKNRDIFTFEATGMSSGWYWHAVISGALTVILALGFYWITHLTVKRWHVRW